MNARFLLASTLALALGACASTPTRNTALEEVRQGYAGARANPEVARLAADELRQAGTALTQAEQAWNARERSGKVDHLAYLASRKVVIAEETAASRAAQAVITSASAERDQLRLGMRTSEADAARREVRSLEAQLRELNARQTERGMVVTFGDVLFDTGRSQVRDAGARDFGRLAAVLRDHPGSRASIEGHTDSVGAASANYLLSERRANAVMAAISAHGVPMGSLSTRAFGQDQPVASNATAAGRQMNRRVEVVFDLAGTGIATK